MRDLPDVGVGASLLLRIPFSIFLAAQLSIDWAFSPLISAWVTAWTLAISTTFDGWSRAKRLEGIWLFGGLLLLVAWAGLDLMYPGFLPWALHGRDGSAALAWIALVWVGSVLQSVTALWIRSVLADGGRRP